MAIPADPQNIVNDCKKDVKFVPCSNMLLWILSLR